MALAGWLNKWFLRSPTAEKVEKTQQQPAPGEEADAQLRAMLESLREQPAQWCESPAPSLDPAETREWMIAEARQIKKWSRGDSTLRLLSEHLIETLMIPDLSLPALPDTAMRLFEMLQDDEITTQHICETLREDPALVQRVWARASSAHFATPPRDLNYAVARVGIRELSRMAAAELISARVFQTTIMHRAADRARMRSLITAELAAQHTSGSRSDAFLGGLMHATGALLLLRTTPQESSSVLALMPSLLRRFEGPLGMLVLDVWSLPQTVVWGVGMQAIPQRLPPEHRYTGQLIRACSIASHGAESLFNEANVHALEALEEVVPEGVSPVALLQSAIKRYERAGRDRS